MKRHLTLAAATVLLLGAGACTADKDKEKESQAAPDDSTCNELLGDAGLKWLEDRTGGKARLKVEDDLKSARSQFYRQVENWGPEDTGVPTFQRATVCLARTDVTDMRKQLEIRYGPSYSSFDTAFGEPSTTGEKAIETVVNSDVKLVHGKETRGMFKGRVHYRVYVKCKIPGTPARQENEIPIEGELADTLTGDTGARVHLTRLLHSAKVVADSFDCENKPVVPAQPPASVK
ncbi:hypothetical protein OG883_28020 [Streptomyces sp. NBC_01142]|uniref:hypothetical protein n=1 Tax=Streptomyces sp. NBC_01142 TaxID=2975865 RepID=UPI00225360E5|nr:hypothetical protein [Streptomyces sp. NBC_01142]MCX4823653.1 hypothetical protein [Streptomyces sp. NBC_01142]